MRPHLDPRVPLLPRASGLQVGVDADHGLIVHGDPDLLTRALRLMNGTRTVTAVAEQSGIDPDLARDIAAQLESHELVVPKRRRVRPRVRLVGSGALARDLAEAICATDLGPLVVVDPEAPQPRVYAHPRPTGAESLKAHLLARGHRVTVDGHWYAGDSGHDVTVVADDRLEPDRALTQVLLRGNRPHLFVRPQVRGVVVGPFVLPGRTACTRCMDLVRSHDPEWVHVLARLCMTQLSTPSTQRAWAVGQVLVSLRAWAAGAEPTTAGVTQELGRDWTVTSRAWPLHPECGCADSAAAA
ncbi:hypothetical protein [Mariniluteicoccus flavus]